MLRRWWAQKREHLSPQDVTAAGGWTDPEALPTAYQSADRDTILDIMKAGERAG